MKPHDFNPPRYLRSPHLQTLLTSRFVRGLVRGRSTPPPGREVDLHMVELDGAPHLKAIINTEPSRPLVILIHGWLGSAQSPYVERVTAALLAAGFGVARLCLRDHGDTEAQNEAMFSSAKIDEVNAAVAQLHQRFGTDASGLVGFSLGGNFALRVALHGVPGIARCLAVCPVIDPASTVHRIDRGWVGYQRYFIGKWRESLIEKQQAFPDIYQIDSVLSLSTVSALTDFIVDRYLPFANTAEYYARYDLTDAPFDELNIPTTILAAADDPVIPADTIVDLAPAANLHKVITPTGGHCGFLADARLGTWLEDLVPKWFNAGR